MDTIARHPLTSLAMVALLVALGLWLSFPPPPAAPAPGRETDAPGLDAANVGQPVTVVGLVVSVAHGRPPAAPGGQSMGATATVVLTVGRREAVCLFLAEAEGAGPPVSGIRVGAPLVVRGYLESIGDGRVYLSRCAVVAESE